MDEIIWLFIKLTILPKQFITDFNLGKPGTDHISEYYLNVVCPPFTLKPSELIETGQIPCRVVRT
ncbi:hypothetical protein DBR24_03835 [Pseudomonas sp. HMWF006]|nr:hypothetical protein DBR24_03835 [Pseudomonas sp. HMWF006]PTT93315.1 hypothetical protein DBR29_07305 [Pseudomonas sp. HMWF005]